MDSSPSEFAAREERERRIDAHYAAGTCHICELVVEPGSAVYGLTGAHWDCHRPSVPEAPHLEPVKPEERSEPKDIRPRLARANGGHLVHIVIPFTGTSLCGHKPKDTAHHMTRRGKWLYWKLDATIPTHLRLCAKCESKALIRFPPADESTEG